MREKAKQRRKEEKEKKAQKERKPMNLGIKFPKVAEGCDFGSMRYCDACGKMFLCTDGWVFFREADKKNPRRWYCSYHCFRGNLREIEKQEREKLMNDYEY